MRASNFRVASGEVLRGWCCTSHGPNAALGTNPLRLNFDRQAEFRCECLVNFSLFDRRFDDEDARTTGGVLEIIVELARHSAVVFASPSPSRDGDGFIRNVSRGRRNRLQRG